jgi:glycosyltransferase involved in cell wall biosynthesis
MLIDEKKVIDLLKEYNINVKGVLHIGAYEYEESTFYQNIGINKNNIICIDSNNNKVIEAKEKGLNNIYYSLITDKDNDEIEFNIINNGQPSNIDSQTVYIPLITFIKKQIHKTTTIDTFYEKNKLDMKNYDFWNFDIQGTELMALKGAKKAIKYAKVLYLEVNTEEVYKGCIKVNEIDKYVENYGFRRIFTKMTNAGWGDALYLRINKMVLYIKNPNWPHNKNLQSIKRMCKSHYIELEISFDLERIKKNDYQILLCTNTYIDPNIIPKNIKIIYGPHHFVFPEGELVGNLDNSLVKRCVYNCLSEWVYNVFYEMVPSLKTPLYSFPFSIEINKFKPNNLPKEYDCLVYIKQRSNDLVNFTLSLLNEKNIKYQLIKYTLYDENDYISLLQKSKFMLVLDRHESQGFALEEAMSCNIPLLVIDATTMYDEMPDGVKSTYQYLKPTKKLLSTSVPYWSDQCGIKITEKNDLSEAIDKMMINYESYTPRNYIINTLSDEICMKRILDYFYNCG